VSSFWNSFKLSVSFLFLVSIVSILPVWEKLIFSRDSAVCFHHAGLGGFPTLLRLRHSFEQYLCLISQFLTDSNLGLSIIIQHCKQVFDRELDIIIIYWILGCGLDSFYCSSSWSRSNNLYICIETWSSLRYSTVENWRVCKVNSTLNSSSTSLNSTSSKSNTSSRIYWSYKTTSVEEVCEENITNSIESNEWSSSRRRRNYESTSTKNIWFEFLSSRNSFHMEYWTSTTCKKCVRTK